MTTLLVCHPGDGVAAAVADHLYRWGRPATAVAPHELVDGAVSYRHTASQTTWAVELPGTVLRREDITGVFNRARLLSPRGHAGRDEEEFGVSERAALLAAMLASIDGPVVNRSNGATLAGPPHFPLHWLALAARVGLPVRRVALGTAGVDAEEIQEPLAVVTVLGDHVHGDPVHDDVLGPAAHEPLRAVARELGCGLLAFTVGRNADGRPVIVALDPTPNDVAADVAAALAAFLVGAAARPGEAVA